MNRTAVFLSLAGIMALGIIGATIVSLYKPESFGALATLVTGALISMTGTAVTLYGLAKNSEKLEEVTTQNATIERQTNGALSLRDAKLDALKLAAREAGVDIRSVLERAEDDHARRH